MTLSNYSAHKITFRLDLESIVFGIGDEKPGESSRWLVRILLVGRVSSIWSQRRGRSRTESDRKKFFRWSNWYYLRKMVGLGPYLAKSFMQNTACASYLQIKSKRFRCLREGEGSRSPGLHWCELEILRISSFITQRIAKLGVLIYSHMVLYIYIYE